MSNWLGYNIFTVRVWVQVSFGLNYSILKYKIWYRPIRLLLIRINCISYIYVNHGHYINKNHISYIGINLFLLRFIVSYSQQRLPGKVAIGKARYLLNIVYLTLGCSNHLFSVELICNLNN